MGVLCLLPVLILLWGLCGSYAGAVAGLAVCLWATGKPPGGTSATAWPALDKVCVLAVPTVTWR